MDSANNSLVPDEKLIAATRTRWDAYFQWVVNGCGNGMITGEKEISFFLSRAVVNAYAELVPGIKPEDLQLSYEWKDRHLMLIPLDFFTGLLFCGTREGFVPPPRSLLGSAHKLVTPKGHFEWREDGIHCSQLIAPQKDPDPVVPFFSVPTIRQDSAERVLTPISPVAVALMAQPSFAGRFTDADANILEFRKTFDDVSQSIVLAAIYKGDVFLDAGKLAPGKKLEKLVHLQEDNGMPVIRWKDRIYVIGYWTLVKDDLGDVLETKPQHLRDNIASLRSLRDSFAQDSPDLHINPIPAYTPGGNAG